jgi:hypothetical protein
MANLAVAFDILARDKASGTLDKVGDKAERTGKRVHGAFSGLSKGLVGAFAGVASVSVFKSFIDEAQESRKIGRLTEQVIKTTGRAAHVSAKQVGELAEAISRKTGFDDEAIQSGQNLLLTFTNVRNEVGKGNKIFDRATETIVDMSVALGQDTKASAIQLGKALNDPIKGVTALSKVGVSFTKQQKEQIKTLVESGRTLDAQKIILAELGREFGGAAAAAATPTDKLKVSIGNLKESIGTSLLPVVDKAATLLDTKVVPAFEGFLKGMQDGTGAGGKFADVVGELGDKAETAWGAVKPMFTFIGDHPKLFSEVAKDAAILAVAFKGISTVKKLPGIGKLLGGGKGGLLGGITAAKPLPVFVTNPGFGGGKPVPGARTPPIVPAPTPKPKIPVAGTVLLAGGALLSAKVGHDIGAAAAVELGKRSDKNLEANQLLARDFVQRTIETLGKTKGIESPEMIAALKDLKVAIKQGGPTLPGSVKSKDSVNLLASYDFLKKYGAKTAEVQAALRQLAADPRVIAGLRERAAESKRVLRQQSIDTNRNINLISGGLLSLSDLAKDAGTRVANGLGGGIGRARERTEELRDAVDALHKTSLETSLRAERDLTFHFGGGLGHAKERADDLKDALAGLPSPRLNTDGLTRPLQGGVDKAHSFITTLGQIPKTKDITVRASLVTSGKAVKIGEVQTSGNTLYIQGNGGKLLLAGGGYVSGPGSARSDSIDARLSNGEFVVNAKATAQHRAELEALNAGRSVATRTAPVVHIERFEAHAQRDERAEVSVPRALRSLLWQAGLT